MSDTEKVKLRDGSQVFACCGGRSFHVGGWHKEMEAEHAEEERRRKEYRDEQEAEHAEEERRRKEYRDEQTKRRGDLVGQVLIGIDVSDDYRLTLKFENGHTLEASLVGGELDGHFDPPGNRSMHVEVKTRARKGR